jgi:hypothetical protein
MDTHENRKALAREALKSAKANGVSYVQIEKATGLNAGSLRAFRFKGNLDTDKTIALLKYLTEQGYVKQDKLRLLPPLEPVKDPWLVLGDKLMIAHDICTSPLYSDVDKLNEIRKFANDFVDYLGVHIAAVENFKRLP